MPYSKQLYSFKSSNHRPKPIIIQNFSNINNKSKKSDPSIISISSIKILLAGNQTPSDQQSPFSHTIANQI